MTNFTIGVFKFIAVLLSPFIVSVLLFYVYYFIRGYRFKKGLYRFVNHGSKLKRIFWDFPKRFVLDSYNRDPDMFREYGIHVICGEQGSGKSIALTYMLLRYQQMYPKMVIKTNYGYVGEIQSIEHWKDVVASENGIYGEIDVLDEMQNWFNSLQSKDFPPEMMTEVTQQRKQKKCIFGTAQVFSRIAKPIREQITFLYKPLTLFGCVTVVRKYKPSLSASDGQVEKEKLRGLFFFVHSNLIRESFDTYRKIEKMSREGFKPAQEQIRNIGITLESQESDI